MRFYLPVRRRSLLAAGAVVAVAISGQPAAAFPAAAAAPPPVPPVTIAEQLELGLDGIGGVLFGTDAETVIADIAALLGNPTDDSGWVHPSLVSACPGGEARSVTWGQLTLYFGDAPVLLPPEQGDPADQNEDADPAGKADSEAVPPSGPATVPTSPASSTPASTLPEAVIEVDLGTAPASVEGARAFFAYTYGSPTTIEVSPADLATADGLGIGTPVEMLTAVYPDVYLQEGEEGFMEARFYVDEHLQGVLTDASPDGLITVIVAGNACIMSL